MLIAGVGGAGEAVRRAGPVGLALVLAEFALRLDGGDVQLDPDDRLELLIDELGGRVVHRPCLARTGRGGASLVVDGEILDHLSFPRRVVVDLDRAVQVDELVVPRRHDLAVHGLGRIPTRRHVGIGARHDHQTLDAVDRAPVRIAASEVGAQARQVVVDDERQCGGRQAGRAVMGSCVTR